MEELPLYPAEETDRPLLLLTAPQLTSPVSTQTIMRDVLIALAPTVVASVVVFGLRAALVTVVSVVACVGFEYLWCRLRGIPHTCWDLSAAVTGVLLACNVPSTLPIYMLVVGAFVAIVLTKELFGGIGCNFANPAIVGRIFLAVTFPSAMATFVEPGGVGAWEGMDAVSSATPLAPAATTHGYLELLLGMHAGVLGETSALAILVGLAYLLVRRVITWHVPVVYVGLVALLSLVVGRDPVAQVLSGGLLLGAVFMATDYTTTPATLRGRVVFAVGCALVTCLIRFWGNLNEGVAYSILFMNLLVPHIDAVTRNTPVGGEARASSGDAYGTNDRVKRTGRGGGRHA